MNTCSRLCLLLALLLAGTSVTALGQNPWTFVGRIKFPAGDSLSARPYLSALDQNGRLYVISSRIDDPNAHNAIYYANAGDTLFKKFIDYNINGDSDTLIGNIGALRGISTLKNDVVVIASQPYPKTKPNTLAAAYYYKNADTNQVERFGFNIGGSGYGSYIQGCDMSKDSMLIAGIDFGTSIRWYNWGNTFKKSVRGSWNLPDTNNATIFSNATEPGGPQSAGKDLIRDVALVPGGNYCNKPTVFYTSRNSISGTQVTGGIAVWSGGTQIQPSAYVPSRVTDFDGFLSFIEFFPCGITVDNSGVLWVAGVDTTRLWVKGFQVEGVNALAMYDLPSKSSTDLADPNGAPMLGPSDVVLTPNGKTAYVVDRYARCAFKFFNTTTDVKPEPGLPASFTLNQNYPNPFNPSTIISFELSQPSLVRLVVTDILGREVARLVDRVLPAGRHAEVFRGDGVPSGVYFYTLGTPSTRSTKKMVLIR